MTVFTLETLEVPYNGGVVIKAKIYDGNMRVIAEKDFESPFEVKEWYNAFVKRERTLWGKVLRIFRRR